MRLSELLASLGDEELERLALEHVRTDEKVARPQMCNLLEGSLRSFPFVSGLVFNRQPPAFSILSLLLQSPSFEVVEEWFGNEVALQTQSLMNQIDGGELLA